MGSVVRKEGRGLGLRVNGSGHRVRRFLGWVGPRGFRRRLGRTSSGSFRITGFGITSIFCLHGWSEKKLFHFYETTIGFHFQKFGISGFLLRAFELQLGI